MAENNVVRLLREASENKGLSIGEAWSLIDGAADEIERLEAECFSLAAGACEWRGGNEHGNPICMHSNTLIDDMGPVGFGVTPRSTTLSDDTDL